MLKPLILGSILLGSLCLSAQIDTSNIDLIPNTEPLIYNPYNQEVQISVAEGLYNFSVIDRGRYRLIGYGPSIGLTYERSFLNALRTQFTAYYSAHEFRYKPRIQDSTLIIIGNPVDRKEFSYIDILGSVLYVFQECPSIKAYAIMGGGVGLLLRGNHHIQGVEEQQYVENPQAQFASSGKVIFGGGMKYYFLEHIGFDMKFIWHHNFNNVVRNESSNNAGIHVEGGICYAF